MKFLQIDEEGFPMLNGLRVDRDYGRELLHGIEPLDQNGKKIFCIRKPEEKIFIESFDQPYVAQNIIRDGEKLFAQMPFDLQYEFSLESLRLDEWDRFHGMTDKDVPFVMSRKAQASFFDLLDEYSDTSVTLEKRTFEVPTLFQKTQSIESNPFWNEIYQTQNPPWNLDAPHPAIKYILPQLKIAKSRFLVLGCGYGHDAAALAEAGHIVTGVDFSDDAIDGARKKYGHIKNLKFEKHDFFNLPESYRGTYDVIFEHTCFCAVDTDRRDALIKTWKNCLNVHGHLLGIFFVHNSLSSVPYGATEWELRERLKSRFQFLFWNRWHGETTRAPTQELIVYAKLK